MKFAVNRFLFGYFKFTFDVIFSSYLGISNLSWVTQDNREIIEFVGKSDYFKAFSTNDSHTTKPEISTFPLN